jgi:glycosyltransferase involved in cell wall biosynthesis
VRLLFVSSTVTGGSRRSQLELAQLLNARGHEVQFLVDDETPQRLRRWWYGQISDAAARYVDVPGSGALRRLESIPGRRVNARMSDGITSFTSPIPENAFRSVITTFQPDVVVGNSVVRLAWRKIHRYCRAQGIATVLYVREVALLNHITEGQAPADAVVANAHSLALAVRAQGIECAMVPSVLDLSVTNTDSTREVALVVNPIASHGIAFVWQLAALRPHIPFVLQESWPLGPSAVAEIEAELARRPNVSLRRVAPPGPKLYGDARLLLVPHLIDNRPRVIAEAQSNGIPVIAAVQPGLEEAVGDGGVLVAVDDVDRWCAAIDALWNDQTEYGRLSRLARAHAARPEQDPDRAVDAFEAVLHSAVEVAASASQWRR